MLGPDLLRTPRPPHPSLGPIAGLGALALLAGCPASVGTVCDDAAAHEVAYAADGTPAYAGQALVIASCGGASYCHTQSTGVQRFGAPGDLVFDPLLVDGAPDDRDAQERLLRAVGTVHRHRDAIYASVVSGTMPPRGRPPVPDLREAGTTFRTYTGPTDTEGTALPAVNTREGAEVLRNWLACGSPVVERTTPSMEVLPCTSDAMCDLTRACDMATGECRPVGDVVARRSTELEPTWSSIHANVLRPTCAVTGCHVGASAFNMLDFSDPEDAYMALTTRDASAGCGMRSYLTPGTTDPTMSVLLDKLQVMPSCGGRMPPSGLSADVVAVIQQWVMNGAMND